MSNADPPVPVPPPTVRSDAQHQVNVTGSNNTLIFGGNVQSTSFSQRYSAFMTKHGVLYWILHVLVALGAAAIWEYRFWFLPFIRAK